MKVLLNPVLGTNNKFGRIYLGVNVRQKQNIEQPTGENMSILPSAAYQPISFKAKPDASFIMAQTGNLCAYSRRPMLLSYDLRTIYAKLAKKTNAQSAINFLYEYEQYMPEVEVEVFDFLQDNSDGGKKTFQDILYDKKNDSIDNLRSKQAVILGSDETDRIISGLSGHARDYVSRMRDSAMYRIYDTQNPFSRHELLNQLDSIQTNDENAAKLFELYNLWYKLPRSFMDFDAFVVKYASSPHDFIAQRLLSMSEKTIEHLVPTARGGKDYLGNYAPVMKLHNNDRGNMRLQRYDALNPDIGIKQNLQKYIDDIAEDIAGKKTLFATRSWYLKDFRKNIQEETEGTFNIKAAEIKPRRNHKLTSSQKGRNRYITNRR